jgi:hypothetical protein
VIQFLWSEGVDTSDICIRKVAQCGNIRVARINFTVILRRGEVDKCC